MTTIARTVAEIDQLKAKYEEERDSLIAALAKWQR